MNNKMIIIGGCVLLVIILTVMIILMQTCSNDNTLGGSSSADQRRLNILRLAESYSLAGEFERALNLIDGILIDNPDDEEARALQMAILSMERSGGNDAFLEAQKQLLEQQLRQNQALISNMNRNNQGAASGGVIPGQTAADIAAAAAAAREAETARREAEAARRAAEQEAEAARRAAAEEERRRVEASLQQGTADSSQGISSGSESVQFYDNLPDLD